MNSGYARAFYETFILALLLTWNPITPLSYVMPWICLGWFIFRANSGMTLMKLFLFLFGFTVITIGYFLFYYNVDEINFLFGSAFLTLITYGCFVFLIVVPHKISSQKYDYFKYAKLIKYLILIQASLGILQLFIEIVTGPGTFDGSVGDKVQGTISPFSFMVDTSDFGNVAFATNMIFMLLFYAPYAFPHKKGRWIFFLGAFSLLCASVLHILLGLVIGIFAIGFLFRKRFLVLNFRTLYIVGAIIAGFALLATLQPSNLTLFRNYAIIIVQARTPKVVSIIESVTELPEKYPSMLLFGFGPGQYSSRAALIGTGEYLGNLPLLPNEMSKPFEEYMWELWQQSKIKEIHGGSAMSKPFFSVLSLYTEFGLIFFLLLIFFLGYMIGKLRKYYLQKSRALEYRYLAFVMAVGIIFLSFVCLIENYLEINQAIFPGLLLYKVFYNHIKNYKDFA